MTGQVRAAYPGPLRYPEPKTALKISAVLIVAFGAAGVKLGLWLGTRRAAAR